MAHRCDPLVEQLRRRAAENGPGERRALLERLRGLAYEPAVGDDDDGPSGYDPDVTPPLMAPGSGSASRRAAPDDGWSSLDRDRAMRIRNAPTIDETRPGSGFIGTSDVDGDARTQRLAMRSPWPRAAAIWLSTTKRCAARIVPLWRRASLAVVSLAIAFILGAGLAAIISDASDESREISPSTSHAR